MAIIKRAQSQIGGLHEPFKQNIDFNSTMMEHYADDLEIRERFVKFAKHLKKVAPKANDFIYFSAIMLYGAEKSIIDPKTGEVKKDKNGKPITAEWIVDEKTGSWKWKCSDPNIKPHRNNNKDIFPSAELKKAYRKWIGRPLCRDHQSQSVDGIRGIIVDTYWDDKYKRVIGLCALDKVNYPDLARKISTGYLTDVSMGTAVGKSICSECGNVAIVEQDFCGCIRSKSNYGEINIDLAPIELSLVVTGAEPDAKLRNIIASLNTYSDEKQERLQELQRAGCVTPGELSRIAQEIEELKKVVSGFTAEAASEQSEEIRNLSEALKNVRDPKVRSAIEERIAELTKEPVEITTPYGMTGSKEMTGGPGSIGQDTESNGPPPWALERRDVKLSNEFANINIKLGALETALRDLTAGVQNIKKEEQMSQNKLLERARARRAMFKNSYFQGGGGLNEPQTYPVDPTNDKLKTDGDKQMVGQGMEPGADGLHPGYESYGNELELKKKLSRAELEDRKMKRHALLSQAEGEVFKDKMGKTYVKTDQGVKEVTPSTAADDMADFEQQVEDYARQKAQEAYASAKLAYFQGGGGVNEPQTYLVDPTNDKLKTDGDKQMVGQGMEPGADGLHPGYESYGNELELKKRLLRADQKLRAKFVLAFTDSDKKVIDKEKSRWEVYAGPEKILEATGSEIYEDELEQKWDVLASKEYGREVLRAIKEDGIERVSYLLKGDIVKTAQPPVPPPPVGMPEVGAPEVGVPEMPEGEVKEDKDGDPVKSALDALNEHLTEAEKALGDLKDAMEEKTGETEAELPSVTSADDATTTVERIANLYASLDESNDELAMLIESVDTRAKDGKTASDVVMAELLKLCEAAIEENGELRKEAGLVVEFAKKKEEDEDEKEEKEDKKKDKKEKKEKDEDEKEEKEDKKKDKKEKKEDEKEEKEDKKKEKKEKDEDEEEKEEKEAYLKLEKLLNARADRRRNMVREAMCGEKHEDVALAVDEDDSGLGERLEEVEEDIDALLKAEKGEKDEEGEKMHPELSELDAQLAQLLDDEDEYEDLDEEGKYANDRRAWREKIAAEYQLKLDQAKTVETDAPVSKSHSLDGLSIKPTGDGAEVEGIVEQHDKIMRQVQNVPQVREAVEHLVKMMKVGAVSEADFDNTEKLEALAVDPVAVKYWKDYFSQADKESGAFATELTKDYEKKQATASKEELEVKMRRAYDLALEMQDKGMIAQGTSALHSQVDEIMKFDDRAFESVKRAVARMRATVKTASVPAIQVGVNQDNPEPESLVDNLRKLW